MENTFKLYTDGSYRESLGMGGYGGYLIAPNGEKVFEFSEIIKNPEHYTKHEAIGLSHGLQLCVEHGVKNLICYTDSKQLALIANTQDRNVQEVYIQKNPTLKGVVDLKPSFEKIEFYFLPRKYNALADKLSRKAVVQLTHPRNARNNFKSSKVKCDWQYHNHHNPEKFQEHTKEDKDFFVFYVQDSILNVYYAKNRDKKITYEKVLKCPTEKKMVNFWASKVAEVLADYTHLKNCVVYCQDKDHASGGDFQSVLSKSKPIPPSARASFTKLEKVLESYESINYYEPKQILKALNLIKVKPVVISKAKSREEVIEALTLLSQDNYKIGEYPHIEKFFDNKKTKENLNVDTLQKLYFNEFLKLSVVLPFSRFEKIPAQIRKDFMETEVPKLKQELIKKGIKLKI
jgi:ribonuclease HI